MRHNIGMGSVVWGKELAEIYDSVYASGYDPSHLEPMVDFLVDVSSGGPVLEFGVGTGRLALALCARGLSVSGVELSPHMVKQLEGKPGADAIPVVVGDMRTTRVSGDFRLVYLVANTIMNVTTQEDQLEVFANAADHLEPGGHFVVAVLVPQLSSVPPGEIGRVFTLESDHVGIETFDDPVGQIAWSHHWMDVDGRLVQHSAPYRYVWPAELDLMARMAGLYLRERWSDWHRSPFTSDSPQQIAVYEKAGIKR